MNLSELDLNLLVALDTLLKERSVTGAGRRIGLSQPAMSRALSKLRHLFGDELLVRAGREYYLTSLAQELEGPVQEIMALISQTVQRRPFFNPAVDEHEFRIAASDYSTVLVLQPLLTLLADQAPKVKLKIRPLDGRVTVNQLESGGLDLGIWSAKVRSPLLQQESLYSDRLVYAVWIGATEYGEALTEQQSQEMPWVGHDTAGHDMTGLEGLTSAPWGGSRPAQVGIDGHLLRLLLVRGTCLITWTHERLGKRFAKLAEIRLLEPPFEAPALGEAMFWHPRRNVDPAHVWLRQQLIEVSAAL